MVNNSKKSPGFTLIELMITILIMSLLLLISVPFTAAWIQGARVNEAKSKLLQGYELARALAQRNPKGARAPAAAAGLKQVDLTLFVCPGDPATSTTCVDGNSDVKWRAELPANTSLVIGSGSGNNQTIGIDSTGNALAASNFTVTNGSQNESGNLL